jgi:ribosomal protein L29
VPSGFLLYLQSSSEKVKAKLIRNKSKAEIAKQLEELKQELAGLKVAKVTGGAPAKLGKMYVRVAGGFRVFLFRKNDDNLRNAEFCDIDR